MSKNKSPAVKSRMLSGSPFLMGDNSTPGVRMHPELAEQMDMIFRECREFGLDFYPTIVELCTYDQISEIASYGGFPVRYPHWSFGMEYEELSRGYEYGMHRISEMVVNTSPCVIYCMDSNTLVDNIDVICHALGHNDFFKQNVFFRGTDTNMMNKFANHGARIREYMARWGKERVTEFIDHVLRLSTLVDSSKEWMPKPMKSEAIRDKRNVYHPDRRESTNEYMDDWVNPRDYINSEKKRIERKELAEELELFSGPERDVFGYIKDHAPLKPWQQDIVSMLHDEACYFAPQRLTKMINEGWASYVDFCMMCRKGLVAAGQKRPDMGIMQYAYHKMLVLGGDMSQNPYKLGFELLMDIEERWNKGRFGREWDECDSMAERENWDKKLGLGKEKVFDVRKYCNDLTLIAEYFTPEFCQKMDYYEKERFPNGEWKIQSRDHKQIKHRLMARYCNGGLPDIRLVDPNHRGKGYFLLQHNYDGRPLYDPFTRETLISIYRLWKNDVVLATEDENGDEFVYYCTGGRDPKNDVAVMYRSDYEKMVK